MRWKGCVMTIYKPLADGLISLRNTASRNETVKWREGNDQLYWRSCLSQFTIQCQEIKSTRGIVTGLIFHNYSSLYNRGVKMGFLLANFWAFFGQVTVYAFRKFSPITAWLLRPLQKSLATSGALQWCSRGSISMSLFPLRVFSHFSLPFYF